MAGDRETEYQAVLSQLHIQSRQLNKIESLLIENATQNLKIADLEGHVETMWKKFDDLVQPNGILSTIQQVQAACPGRAIQKEVNQIWRAVGAVVAALLSLFGWTVFK